MSLLRSSIHPNQNKFLFFIWSYFNLGHAWGKVFTFPFEFQLVRPERAGSINCRSSSDPTFTSLFVLTPMMWMQYPEVLKSTPQEIQIYEFRRKVGKIQITLITFNIAIVHDGLQNSFFIFVFRLSKQIVLYF